MAASGAMPASACAARSPYRGPRSSGAGPGTWSGEAHEIDAVIAMSEFSRRKHLEFGLPCEPEVLPYFLPDPEPDARRVRVPRRTSGRISSSPGGSS